MLSFKKFVVLASLLIFWAAPASALQAAEAIQSLESLNRELASLPRIEIEVSLEKRKPLVDAYQRRLEEILNTVDYASVSQLSADTQQYFAKLTQRNQCFLMMLRTQEDLRQRYTC
jgi:hypothetical protein